MQEAAQLMNLPVSALESDYEKAAESARQKAAFRTVHVQPEERPQDDIPPEYEVDFADDDSLAGDSAAAPENNPPCKLELELCQFLFEHERDRSLAPLLEYLPAEVLEHTFTRGFVDAWKLEFDTGEDEPATFGKTLGDVETKWFSDIVFSDKTTQIGERDAPTLFRDFLRSAWVAAVRRRLGAMPADSSPENDRARLELQMLVHTFQRAPWERAARKMTLSSLGDARA